MYVSAGCLMIAEFTNDEYGGGGGGGGGPHEQLRNRAMGAGLLMLANGLLLLLGLGLDIRAWGANARTRSPTY